MSRPIRCRFQHRSARSFLVRQLQQATEQIVTSLKTITSNIQALMESMEQIEAASNNQAEQVQQFSEAIEKPK